MLETFGRHRRKDEYLTIRFMEDWETSGYDGVLAENMVLCVESYVGAVGGS